jgi:hypothetical protein
LAPRDVMQFGKALERILQTIVDANPRFGPAQLIKVDIADGFYRIWRNNILKLAVALPAFPGKEPLLALPLYCSSCFARMDIIVFRDNNICDCSRRTALTYFKLHGWLAPIFFTVDSMACGQDVQLLFNQFYLY